MFEIIENIGAGDFVGNLICWFVSALIFIFILDQFNLIAKIKKIK